ncbi:DUF410-domain-containing protein [Neoconidiobolus thromboides FSU 785]|nr:DUF410-domain-containing protein [Neoconidiobolus thromboides FSU 785]
MENSEDVGSLSLSDLKGKGSKQDKTLKKLEASLKEGDFYQAHQIYRSVCNRFYNNGNYGKAIEMLYKGALTLLKFEQYSSASDLGIYLIKAYESSKTPINEQSIQRLKEIIDGFPSTEKARSFLITEALYWNIKSGSFKSGEPIFHDLLGDLYNKDGEFEQAEPHYIFGSEATGDNFGEFLYRWALSVTPLSFGYFLARGVLSKLVIGNATSAILALNKFISLLFENQKEVLVDSEAHKASFVETKLPLVNFIQLLCTIITKDGSRDLFVKLRNQYSEHLVSDEFNFTEYMNKIGEIYFGIRIHRPVNIMQSLMESMFQQPSSNPNALSINSFSHDETDLD